MSENVLRYDEMVEKALRGVVRDALSHVAAHGLPGDHHFYITFRTDAPGVAMPDFLREQYPAEMTIVLQHQFWDLAIDAAEFSVTLSFSNRPAQLTVPFAALTAFVDPSVKFGLQFNVDEATPPGVPAVRQTGELAPLPDNESAARGADEGEADEEEGEDGDSQGAEVVSLDTFRKK